MPRQKSTPTKSKNQNDFSIKAFNYIPKANKKLKRKMKKPLSYNVIKPSENNKQYYLGELLVGTIDNVITIKEWSTCSISFLPSTEEGDSIILNFNNDKLLVVKLLMETALIKEIVVSKVFLLDINANDNGNLYFNIYIDKLPLLKFNSRLGNCLKVLFNFLYNISESEYNNKCERNSKKLVSMELESLYNNIRMERENIPEGDVQHVRLNPILRPYQSCAVNWMINREKQSINKEILHPLYIKVELKSGLCIYFNKYTGYIELNPPMIKSIIKGAILADEMGLGKTVEVLACILNHTAPNNCDINNLNLNEIPIIKQIKNKRIKRCKPNEEAHYVDEPIKLKIPNDWIKKQKSQNYVALNMWYENELATMNVNNNRKRTTPKQVQCVCGILNFNNTISCIDCNKIQHKECVGYKEIFGDYRCPQCWTNQPLIESKATLIVCPLQLRKQWTKEISKHIKGNFLVLEYEGCSQKPIYPLELKDFDIVVTTYNVLQAELKLLDAGQIMSLRNQRKYSPPCCPLTRINWWRLCLDEAQTVESPNQMVSEMAKRLNAHFRWAVTGTPLSKDISELYGLIDYLQIEPYNDPIIWKHLLLNPYINGNPEVMHKFLSKIMWRSSKNDVIDQINIPNQTIKEYWLDFSPVEKYFYKCELNVNTSLFLEKTQKYDKNKSLESLDKSSLKNVITPLLSLRQVCTFPNTVKVRYLATKKPVSSMKELLDALIDKNTNENEEYLRIIISSLNGLAGIYLLLQNPYQSIQEYRKVLQLYTRFSEEEKIVKLNIDKLLIIHTMHNLAEILDIYPDIYEPTLRDTTLKKDCQEIEQKYIEKFINQSLLALKDNFILTENVVRLQNSFKLKAGQWYTDLLQWIYIHNYGGELANRIKSAHDIAGVECTIDLYDERNITYIIASWDESLGNIREDTISYIEDLYEYLPDKKFKILISQNIVDKARECHLRPEKKSKKKLCPLCLADQNLKKYEFKLFSMIKRKDSFETMSLKGSWKPTSEELVFKSLLNLAKQKHAKREIIEDGEIHINLIETLKKEFKEIRKLWTYLNQQICAKDELDICKIRLSLLDPTTKEEKPKKKNILKSLSYAIENKTETINILNEHELDYQRSILEKDEIEKMNRLEKNIGTRNYLETLRKQQYEGQNPDPCPICKNDLINHWSIISCGHSYCIECIESLVGGSGGIHSHYVTCSVCRRKLHVNNISYIKPGISKLSDKEKEIKGNYSTKIEAIVKLLLKLKTDNEKVKVLIFSSWMEVLTSLKTALEFNNINCVLGSLSNFEKRISNFKDESLDCTALLMPINLGSKGLNIIEATHVILVEPLLNPSDELQAIGRIHRIGQTKPTVVHKFIVRNTIEENIYKAVTANAENWDKTKVTLGQLMDLFLFNSNNSIDEETDEGIE